MEDEILAQQVIQNHLKKIDSFELVGTCSHALEAKEILERQEVDVIFLDIQLPGMTGLNFLRSLTRCPLVVLTTAYAEYALESYDFNVIDYLLKPISFERFSKTTAKIMAEGVLNYPGKEVAQDHIFIKSNGKFFRVNFSEILYIEGMKDYLRIHTQDHSLITHQTMTDMEKILPPQQFMRVHKSYLVAIACIKSIFGNSIETKARTIPIGINYKERVMNLVRKR